MKMKPQNMFVHVIQTPSLEKQYRRHDCEPAAIY